MAPQRSAHRRHNFRHAIAITLVVAEFCTFTPPTNAQLTGALGIHDPSSVIKDGSLYYLYGTGQGIAAKWSSDLTNWHDESTGVYLTPPSWTTQAVPSFTGFFWAPDISYFNGTYHLYYAVSSFGTIDSAIGVATSPTLNRSSPNYGFTDLGKVVQSDAVGQAGPNTDTTAFNTIDPSILVDNATGKVWMSFGSYSSGILVTQLDPSTGKRLNPGALDATLVANNAPGGGWGSSIEGSALVKRGSFYYLFVNYGGCCSGIDSTYNIRVGRSSSPTGPFLDKDGVDMRDGGGSIFLDDDGKMTGPGQFGYYTESGQDYFGYHYYNGDSNGAPTYGFRKLYWTSDAWPSEAPVNPKWTGTTNANWSVASNWTSEGVPNGVGNIANFSTVSSGRYSVTVDGGGKTVSTINFNSPSASYTIGSNAGPTITLNAQTGDSATINVLAGSGQTIAAPVSAVQALGVNTTTADTSLTMSGSVSAPSLTKYGRGTLTLSGANTYTGSVFVTAGTLDISGSLSAGNFTSVGRIVGDTATMTVRGAGSFTTNTDLNIGDSGAASTPATGTLNIQNSATVTINSGGGFYVGSGFFANTQASGTVNQSGGTLTANGNFDGAFIIGGRTSTLPTGVYNLSGGTVNANTNVQVGGRATGTMNQSGGVFNTNSYLSIGRYSGATGAWNISSGTLNQTNSSRTLIVGEEGNGTLTVSGSGSVNTAGQLRIGLTSTGAGTVNLNGGTLSTVQVAKGSGTATFNFNGGTLRAAAASTSFLQGLTQAKLNTGGAIIDTQAFNITIAQPLLHDAALGATPDGGIGKIGSGTLTLAGTNTYIGSTTVNAGALRVNGSIPGTVTVISNAALGGSGSIGGLVTIANGGILSPGNSPGILTVGSLNLNSGSQTQIELGGMTVQSQYDQLHVTGEASLGGALSVSLINSFAPALGNHFDIFASTTENGIFSSLSLPTLSAGLAWNTTSLYSSGSLSVIDANYLPGDLDRDGHATSADLAVLLSALTDLSGYEATHGPGGGALTDQQLLQIADLTGDNQVTNEDIQGLIYYLSHSAAFAASSPLPVPEPSTLALAAMATIGVAIRRYASRKSRTTIRRANLS